MRKTCLPKRHENARLIVICVRAGFWPSWMRTKRKNENKTLIIYSSPRRYRATIHPATPSFTILHGIRMAIKFDHVGRNGLRVYVDVCERSQAKRSTAKESETVNGGKESEWLVGSFRKLFRLLYRIYNVINIINQTKGGKFVWNLVEKSFLVETSPVFQSRKAPRPKAIKKLSGIDDVLWNFQDIHFPKRKKLVSSRFGCIHRLGCIHWAWLYPANRFLHHPPFDCGLRW